MSLQTAAPQPTFASDRKEANWARLRPVLYRYLRRAVAGFLGLAVILTIFPAFAQQRGEDPRARIRTEVSLVSLLSSVLDKDGRPALDLTADQFEVYEEGVKQNVEIFEPETQQPLDLTIMVDASLSEIKDLAFEGEAASRFIQKVMRPSDRMSIFEFADAVTQLE